uniref:Uncharacterized protein n=1 Tax=Romanomermis culicivorax TaxID=13658 RepID=A0A915KD74_ROMCU
MMIKQKYQSHVGVVLRLFTCSFIFEFSKFILRNMQKTNEEIKTQFLQDSTKVV